MSSAVKQSLMEISFQSSPGGGDSVPLHGQFLATYHQLSVPFLPMNEVISESESSSIDLFFELQIEIRNGCIEQAIPNVNDISGNRDRNTPRSYLLVMFYLCD